MKICCAHYLKKRFVKSDQNIEKLVLGILKSVNECLASSNIVLPSSVSVRHKWHGSTWASTAHPRRRTYIQHQQSHTRFQHTRTAQGFSKSRLLLEITQSGDSRRLQSFWWRLARLTHSCREGQRAECKFRQAFKTSVTLMRDIIGKQYKQGNIQSVIIVLIINSRPFWFFF